MSVLEEYLKHRELRINRGDSEEQMEEWNLSIIRQIQEQLGIKSNGQKNM